MAVEIAELAHREKISEPAADPILDRLPQQRGKRAAKSVLRILDNLDQEGSR